MRATQASTGLTALLVLCASASAQVTRSWLGGATFYDSPAAWSPSGTPTNVDTIVFSNPFDSDVRFDSITGNRTAAFLQNTAGSPRFLKSDTSNSTLTITGTSAFTGSGTTTIESSSSGLMTLSSSGLTTVDNSRNLRVGPNGRLIFGEMRVGTSAGSALLAVSSGGSLQGTTLEVGRLGLLSRFDNFGGQANFTSLRIASDAKAAVTVTGGSVTALEITLGNQPGSDGSLTVNGGLVTSIDRTLIGTGLGQGLVTVRTGGTFNNLILQLGAFGRLTTSGGTVFTNSFISDGTFRLEAGEFRYANYLNLSSEDVFEFISGTVHRTGSGVTTNDDLGPGAVGFIFNGEAQVLRFGQKLISDNPLQLNRPLTLDGGTLVVPSLINGQTNLGFQSGTLELTTAFNISTTGPLGRMVDLKPGSVLIARGSCDIFIGSTLYIRDGAAFRFDAAFANAGNLVLDGLNARVAGVATVVNNTSAGMIRGHGEVDAAITNGGTIELSDVGALRINGALTNSASGTVRGRGRLVASTINNFGRFEFSGGFADIESPLTNQATARVVVSGGGVLTFFGNVTHATGADIRSGTGSRTVFLRPVTGAGTFSGAGLVQFENTYTPGSSPGLVSFGGDVQLTDLANLGIELAGSTRGSQYDALDVAGTIELQGRLSLSTLSGYVPAYGVGHRVIDAGSRSGIFDQITGIELSPARFLAVTYNATGDVFVTAALPGDTNLDGSVNFTDLLAVAQNFNATSRTWSEGDFGGDTQVGFADLLVLAQNFGASVLASGEPTLDQAMNASFQTEWARAMAVVPEPTTLGVLMLGAWALIRRR